MIWLSVDADILEPVGELADRDVSFGNRVARPRKVTDEIRLSESEGQHGQIGLAAGVDALWGFDSLSAIRLDFQITSLVFEMPAGYDSIRGPLERLGSAQSQFGQTQQEVNLRTIRRW